MADERFKRAFKLPSCCGCHSAGLFHSLDALQKRFGRHAKLDWWHSASGSSTWQDLMINPLGAGPFQLVLASIWWQMQQAAGGLFHTSIHPPSPTHCGLFIMHHQLPVIIQQPPIRLKPWRRNAPSSSKIWIESTGGKRLLEEDLNMKSKNSCRCEPSPRLFDTYSRYYLMFCIICLWCFGLAGSGAPCDTALQNVMLVLFWVSWLQSISQFTCLQVTVLYIYIYIYV